MHSHSPSAGPSTAIDIGPVIFVLGRFLTALAGLMALPALVDWLANSGNEGAFLQSMVITGVFGVALSMTTSNRVRAGINTRQAYLLTFLIWTLLPVFAGLPFLLGAPGLSLTDAYFEAASGITTTGATVIVGLDTLPPGMNVWRGLLNWIGGLGIVFVVMIFLPVMRVGGMQFFRTEGFDTMGKVLPRAVDIARALVWVYCGLTVLFVVTYRVIGMEGMDAFVNGLATVATGGFSSSDASFAKYPGLAEYLGAVFMIMSAVPFVLYVQMLRGQRGAILGDPQVRVFLVWAGVAVLAVAFWKTLEGRQPPEQAFRETLFNLTSIMTGTGFFSGSFVNWEGPALATAFVLGLIGGCSGSSSGAMSVFRVQVSLRAIALEIRRIHSPNRVEQLRYGGRAVAPDVTDALAFFVTGYVLILGLGAVAIGLTGADLFSAVFASWQAIGNIGYGFGPLVVPTGTFRDFSDVATWIMAAQMLLGRLGLLTLLVVFLPRFWRS